MLGPLVKGDIMKDALAGWDSGFLSHAHAQLKLEAARLFCEHHLPTVRAEWEPWRRTLRARLWELLGTPPDDALDLDMRVLKTLRLDGYRVDNVIYQSRPRFYVTASLYVPNGAGPFPAALNVHGHYFDGHLADDVQARAHTLARKGYVVLSVDAFGAGERATTHGRYEYHGGHLGVSVYDIGETLMGMQVVDNMRGVSLLRSLPCVQADKIGVTGASGGGNQTMWVAAMDERLAAAMPVVSVGTFEIYVAGSNCICETLPGVVPLTEMSGILALIAPRALKICNALGDSNPTFYPAQMLRSFVAARPVWQALGADERLAYQVFNLPHGYGPEVREVLCGWFDRWLKGVGDGSPQAHAPVRTLRPEQLMCFRKGARPPIVPSISEFCRERGEELIGAARAQKAMSAPAKRKELRRLLRMDGALILKDVREFPPEEIAGRTWQRIVLSALTGEHCMLLLAAPRNPKAGYAIIPKVEGKTGSPDPALVEQALARGQGVLLFTEGAFGDLVHHTEIHHDSARAHLWLGKTFLGERARGVELVTAFLRKRSKGALSLAGTGEGALAALFCAAVNGGFARLDLSGMPCTYVHVSGKSPFSMGVHVPGFLAWGDVALAVALARADVTITRPLHLDGSPFSRHAMWKLQKDVAHFRKVCGLRAGRFSVKPGRKKAQETQEEG
jgi:hypothetical protein